MTLQHSYYSKPVCLKHILLLIQVLTGKMFWMQDLYFIFSKEAVFISRMCDKQWQKIALEITSDASHITFFESLSHK